MARRGSAVSEVDARQVRSDAGGVGVAARGVDDDVGARVGLVAAGVAAIDEAVACGSR